jgi:hypothetical protein
VIERRQKDIFLTDDGDLFFNEKTNDLKTIDNKNSELLLNVIKRRLKSSDYDWSLLKPIRANLDYVKGLTRDAVSIEVLKSLIAEALIENLLVSPDRLDVKVIGIDNDIIGIGVIIYESIQETNSYIQLGFSYDYRENRFSAINELEGI